MADIYEYVRVCIFEKFPINISIPSNFIADHELVGAFQSQFSKALEPFGILDSIPLETYSWHIFSELDQAGLVDKISDPLAGDFFWADFPKIANYMRAELKASEIFARKKALAGDRFYHAVFGNFASDADGEPSSTPTGQIAGDFPKLKSKITESERTEFRLFIPKMREEIEDADLSQEERADALASIAAIDSLSGAPNPIWQAIVLILSSPILANVTSLTSLAIAVLTA